METSRIFHSEERDAMTPGRRRHRRTSLPAAPGKDEAASFSHYGSSLSLSNKASRAELVSRTLRPPTPVRLSSPPLNVTNTRRPSPRPSLPNVKVDLESPKLADYLEKPRYVSTGTINGHSHSSLASSRLTAAEASIHHAKRMLQGSVRNNSHQNMNQRIGFGNFLEGPENDELIPERLRQYYLNTYLNVCNTCDALLQPVARQRDL